MGSWVPAEAAGVFGVPVALLAPFPLPSGGGEEELGLLVLRVMAVMGAHEGPTPCPTPLGGSELLSPPAELCQPETLLPVMSLPPVPTSSGREMPILL